ncbi:MAG TPA: AraC family transcriptional regulator, partial [Polyangia bacterium]
IDPDAALREAAIAPELFADPSNTVSIERVHALVRMLLDRTGDPSLGLDAGRHYHLATFGLLGAVVAVTPTLREAIRLFVEYAHMTFTFCDLAFEEDGDKGRLVLVCSSDLGALHRFYMDRDLSALAATGSAFWPETWRDVMVGVDFDYPEPVEAARYRALFPCRVRFGAAQAAIAADFAYDRPRGDPNPLGLGLLNEHLRSFGAAHAGDGSDVAEDVRREIALSLAQHHQIPTLASVAASLGVSERVLRRRLNARGVRYRALADEIVAPLAKRYLVDSTLTLDDVAERLGYSEPASFVRAFRRWTGTTPDKFRHR